MSVAVVLWVIFVHWFGDFICQTHWQASNKSKNWDALTRHVAVYTWAMTFLLVPVLCPFGQQKWPSLSDFVSLITSFFLVTFACHFATDAITSRVTSRLWKSNFFYNGSEMAPDANFHNFFVVIGFDQFLHYAQLFITIAWLQHVY